MEWTRCPSTRQLQDHLVQHDDLKGRAKAADLLGARRHPGVPESLLVAMNTDGSIWVRTTALRSFERVSGYDAADVFHFEEAQRWYHDNQEKVAGRLTPDPTANQAAKVQ